MLLRYYSNLPARPAVRPSDGLPAIGVMADPTVPHSIIGIAYPYTHVGGCRPDADPLDEYAPPEVVFRLVIDRAWQNERIIELEAKDTHEARYVLRGTEFIELSEEAL